MAERYRQEVLNVLLAQLLEERGAASAPESITRTANLATRQIPDVLVRFRGLRVAIEGEVSDTDAAMFKATRSALRRVVDGLAHIGVALVYPENLRSEDFGSLKDELEHATIRIAIVTESGDIGPVEGDVDQLESALRHAFDQLVEEDAVNSAVELLHAAIGRFATSLEGKVGATSRLKSTLGIGEVSAEDIG